MKKVKIFQLLLSFISLWLVFGCSYALIVFDKARPDRAVGYYLE